MIWKWLLNASQEGPANLGPYFLVPWVTWSISIRHTLYQLGRVESEFESGFTVGLLTLDRDLICASVPPSVKRDASGPYPQELF